MSNSKKTNKTENFVQSQVMLDGSMIIAREANGLHTADFECCEINVELEPFMGKCRVQCMRNGNVYVTELPKRKKSRPMKRLDHSSFTMGADRKFHFSFVMPFEGLIQLPEKLKEEAEIVANAIEGELAPVITAILTANKK